MTIVYDGAEFSSVAELVEYKNLTENIEPIKINTTIKLKQKKIPNPIKREKNSRSWSKTEIDILKKYYQKYFINEKISLKGLNILTKRLKRTKQAIKSKFHEQNKINVNFLNVEKRTYKPAIKQDKRQARMKYISNKARSMMKLDQFLKYDIALKRASDEWGNLNQTKYKVQSKFKPKTTYVEKISDFPRIWPLSETGNKTFESLMADLIQRKDGQIDYMIGRNNLAVSTDREWSGRLWREFCSQVMLNSKKIASALFYVKAKPEKIKIKLENGFHIIKYE